MFKLWIIFRIYAASIAANMKFLPLIYIIMLALAVAEAAKRKFVPGGTIFDVGRPIKYRSRFLRRASWYRSKNETQWNPVSQA